MAYQLKMAVIVIIGAWSISSASAQAPVIPCIAVAAGGCTPVTSANPLPSSIVGVEQPDVTGTFTNATQTTSIISTSQDGYGTALISVSGTYGTASGAFEMSDDNGITWSPMAISRSDGSGADTGYASLTNLTRAWIIPTAGMDLIRVRSTAVASGTVNVRISSSSVQTSPIPLVPTIIAGNASGSTGAVVGTLTAAANKLTSLCDFNVSALGTANTVGPVVVAGLLGGSRTYQAGTLATGVEYYKSEHFNPCLPASAPNTAITITTTAAAGGTAVNVNSSGYQQ